MRYEKFPTLDNWLINSNEAHGRVQFLAARFNPAMANQPVVPPAPRSPDLAAIDRLVDLYNRAFAPMSKYNVLFDLQADLARKFANTPNEGVKALKDIVGRLLADMPKAGRYSQVMCVGWNVGCNYDHTTGITSPNPGDNDDYFRHSPDDQTDMILKCAEMYKAISAALTSVQATNQDNAQTLKIFLAPEFYFRGKNGAYSPEIVSQILPKMKELGVQSPNYSDWLFVFGTAVAAIELEVTYCKTCGARPSTIKFVPDPMNPTKTIAECKNDTKPPTHDLRRGRWGAEVQNVALIQKGQETGLVAKEYISSIDYVGADQGEVTIHPGTTNETTVSAVVPSGSTDARWGGHPHSFVSHNDERLGGCRVTIDGIRIALEVCLDHHHTIKRAQPLEGSTQILLIPSYGMDIGTGLYCVPDGVVFNVDGRGLGSTEVVVKGKFPKVARTSSAPVVSGRGTVDLWGPYLIPV